MPAARRWSDRNGQAGLRSRASPLRGPADGTSNVAHGASHLLDWLAM